jgi:hypothetical protein
MIMVASLIVHPLNYYLDEDKNDLALILKKQTTTFSGLSNNQLTMGFSCTSDHPLRIMIFISMIINRYNIHINDVFTGWIKSSYGYFEGRKHPSKIYRCDMMRRIKVLFTFQF